MWNPFKKKDPQPIEPKSREEFVKRLKEISQEPNRHEESLGAMCYCPAPQPPFGNEDKDGEDDSLPCGCWFIIITIVVCSKTEHQGVLKGKDEVFPFFVVAQ